MHVSFAYVCALLQETTELDVSCRLTYLCLLSLTDSTLLLKDSSLIRLPDDVLMTLRRRGVRAGCSPTDNQSMHKSHRHGLKSRQLMSVGMQQADTFAYALTRLEPLIHGRWRKKQLEWMMRVLCLAARKHLVIRRSWCIGSHVDSIKIDNAASNKCCKSCCICHVSVAENTVPCTCSHISQQAGAEQHLG